MADAKTAEQPGLDQRVKWLIVFRLVIAALLVFATLYIRPGLEDGAVGPSFAVILSITVGHLIIAAVFGLLYRFLRIYRLVPFVYYQIIWDVVFATALVYVTGGIESEFKFMYWLTIINAAVLLFRKGAFSAAALSGIFYGLLVDLEYFGVIPLPFSEQGAWQENKVIASIVLNSVGFFVVAYVFSHFSVRLRHTERMLVEKSLDLEDLEDLTRRIVESLTSGLATLDSEGRINYWSRASEEITGLQLGDVRGKSFTEIFSGTPEKVYFGPAQEESSERETKRWEIDFVAGARGNKRLGFSSAPLRYGNQKNQGDLVIFQDLTQYQEMEEQVKRADRLAAIGELAARMAHEIRNPLTSLSGAIEVLKNQLDLGDQDQKLMEIVIRETDRLNDLLTDFLHFARPTPFKFEDVNINQILGEASDLFSKSQADNKLKINLRINGEMHLQADPQKISQMMWNLLKNAGEAMAGEGVVDVFATEDLQTNELLIEVSDRGPGISPEMNEKIFQPFVTTKVRGTGLGLAMVRRIVEEHKGGIAVDSSAGAGATFKIRLPGIITTRAAVGVL